MPAPILIAATALAAAAALLFGISTAFRSGDPSLCTRHTQGRVAGVSAIAYFDHHIPLCEFEADGRVWRVAGPKFANSVVGATVQSNLTSREDLPDVLRAPTLIVNRPGGGLDNLVVTNETLYEASPLSRLYPIGSQVDIWYDPANPKNAYVQRPVDASKLPRLVLRIMAGCCAGASATFLALGLLGVFGR